MVPTLETVCSRVGALAQKSYRSLAARTIVHPARVSLRLMTHSRRANAKILHPLPSPSVHPMKPRRKRHVLRYVMLAQANNPPCQARARAIPPGCPGALQLPPHSLNVDTVVPSSKMTACILPRATFLSLYAVHCISFDTNIINDSLFKFIRYSTLIHSVISSCLQRKFYLYRRHL